ncbi:MAG: lipoyl synthase [Candidatus Omnitrophica bacterium]|nr:lipoyl synthase [Candidatus Omnitrophota bacterium]MBI2173597.1 lipoyl synthase [Candidatus Omnitrophota bacterium]MBI3010749.1 lipoyl synthase [Candidatus Omnitrophota bacterium]
MQRYPVWLKRSFSPDGVVRQVRDLVADLQLTTVCESALCPNLSECYSQRQLTFMILGSRCTRRCGFCAIDTARPFAVDPDEPQRIAQAIERLNLRHAVLTSVARDDLRDEGAGHFVAVLHAIRKRMPQITLEVLVPDFHAKEALIRQVVCEGYPEVFAHNVETIKRLSRQLRPQADYHRSLKTLTTAASLGANSKIKSSVMVGLGETQQELEETFRDLSSCGVTHLTVGQYLRPTPSHLPVVEYLAPEQFVAYEQMAYACGMRWVKAGPFVRSSYHAAEALTATV